MRRAIFSSYIVRLLGIINEEEVKGIVMDYFEHGSLKSFLPYLDCDCWARKARMLCDISSGLNHLHNLTPPLVHRDVKLSNIFVDRGFTAKVIVIDGPYWPKDIFLTRAFMHKIKDILLSVSVYVCVRKKIVSNTEKSSTISPFFQS